MPHNTSKPIFYDGKWFSSINQAAIYAKVHPKTILYRIKNGYTNIKRNAFLIETPFGKFNAVNQVEKQLGLPKSTILRKLKRGEPGYKYL